MIYPYNLTKKADVILDTDAYNEVDDQFAIAYLLRSQELNPVGFIAAPFFNERADSPEDGMEKSYDEIIRILKLAKREDLIPYTYRGSKEYLTRDSLNPIESEGARKIVELAKDHSPENPLYVVAIAAITNVASAFLLDPSISESTVVIWLGGQQYDCTNFPEFNLNQDIYAARIVMERSEHFVMLPCRGVVSGFRTSYPEMEHWLKGKGDELTAYLLELFLKTGETHKKAPMWSRPIWDVTAVAWLLNKDERFMEVHTKKRRLPQYDGTYEPENPMLPTMELVTYIQRDILFSDLIQKVIQ